MLHRTALVTAVLAVALPLAACTSGSEGSTSVAARSDAVTTVASPVSSAPPVAPRLDVVPAAGTVTRLAGPFDDRVQLSGTTLTDGVVRTALAVTSDVSEIIVLEAQADFYDRAGLLLGTARTTHEDDHADGEEHDPSELVELVLPAEPAWAGRVHSAVLSLPVLVNE